MGQNIRSSYTYYYVAYKDTKEVFYKNPTLLKGFRDEKEIYRWFLDEYHIIISDDADDAILLEYHIYTQDELDARKYKKLLDEGVNPTLLKMIEKLQHDIALLTTGGNVVTLNDITSDVICGSVSPGEVIPAGTDIEALTRYLLLESYNPTLSPPTLTLFTNVSGKIEVGSVLDISITANFNRGIILGDLISGVWNPNVKQADRTGPVTEVIINGSVNGVNINKTLDDYNIIEGDNMFTSKVSYGAGVQPEDSKGQPYNTPYPDGFIEDSLNIEGVRKAFYGFNSLANDSATVRSLASNILDPQNGTTFTLNIPSGTTSVIFAYPSSLRDVTSVLYVESMNMNIKDAFTKTGVFVSGDNGYNPIEYKVYKFTPIEPYDATATYVVTI